MFKLFGKKKAAPVLVAIASGIIKPLSEVADPVFAGGMMGIGYGLDPTSDQIVSPAAGTVTMVADTLHGIGIHTEEGMDVLIHMGIDTVELKGAPFTVAVKVGDHIKAGQALASMARAAVETSGKSTTLIVVVTNSNNLDLTVDVKAGNANAGDAVASIRLPSIANPFTS